MHRHKMPPVAYLERRPRVKVIGLGGAGCNTIHRLSSAGIPGVSLIAANTDSQALSACNADDKILLGGEITRGLGSGGNPGVGRQAAEESFREMITCIKDSDFLFLTAGMGGGTGSGAIEIASRIAKSLQVMTIAVVTLPFSFESGVRSRNALEATERLRPYANTLITIPNDRLMMLTGRDCPLVTAFALADDLLVKSIQGLSALIQSDGCLNLDMSHVLRLLKHDGGCSISTGLGSGDNAVMDALNQALCHPLLEEIPVQHASGIIVKLTGNLSVSNIQQALDFLRVRTSSEVEILTAIGQDDILSAQGKVQAMLLLTGVGGVEIHDETQIVDQNLTQTVKARPEEFIPVAGEFPTGGFTPSNPSPEVLEAPAFLRNRYTPFEHFFTCNETRNN